MMTNQCITKRSRLNQQCKLPFYTKSTAQARTKTRVGPKLVVFLHPSAKSGRLSRYSLSPEFRSLALLYVHADHFVNDCAYGSIGFIILVMACELFLCIYVAFCY